MKPVKQIVMHDPDNGRYGDCMRAAIASLLELPLNRVPHFYEEGTDEDYDYSLKTFLFSKGFVLLSLSTDANITDFIHGGAHFYHIMTGPTSRFEGKVSHAVVGFNGRVVHDPHPDNTGLDENKKDEWGYSFLVKSC